MSGVSVVLDRARIGLWSDPSTELAIPHLLAAPATITHAGTTAQFVASNNAARRLKILVSGSH